MKRTVYTWMLTLLTVFGATVASADEKVSFEVKAPKAAALPAIDRERLYRPQKTQDGSPVLPSEWLDPEGDVYDSLA